MRVDLLDVSVSVELMVLELPEGKLMTTELDEDGVTDD